MLELDGDIFSIDLTQRPTTFVYNKSIVVVLLLLVRFRCTFGGPQTGGKMERDSHICRTIPSVTNTRIEHVAIFAVGYTFPVLEQL